MSRRSLTADFGNINTHDDDDLSSIHYQQRPHLDASRTQPDGQDIIQLDSCIDITSLQTNINDQNSFLQPEHASWSFTQSNIHNKRSNKLIRENNKAYMKEMMNLQKQQLNYNDKK